ncbi:MAG: amidohydrolase family protein [Luteitalea sp.]|nr:amidohydrolase family protein [Luteitalea sp.]
MLLIGSMSLAQEAPQAFLNARIIPISGPVIERGVLVVQDAKILAVGPASSVQVPSGAKRHDLDGKTIMPGLVDTHSHIGGGSGGDRSAPIQPDVRILDAIDVRNTGIRRAQAGGITTVNVMPGSGHLLSGQTVYLKLRRGRTIDDLLIRDGEERIAGGLKMANGTNSIDEPPFPGTRAKSVALARKAFVEAIDYRDKLKRAGDDPEKRPARDLGLETLLEVLDGRRVVHFHTHRHDDILTVIRLSKEFGFRPVLQHVSEGWKVADEIAKAGLACSVIVLDSPGGKIEAKDVSLTTGAVLDKAGVLVGFHTDDYITDSRLFLRSAALAVRAGMARDSALAALTTAGAQMLGLEPRIGSLEAGKDADFIVLSGDPLSVYTHVEQTWIEGQKVFDRSNAEDRLYAVGGYGASRDNDVHVELGEEAR